MVRFLISWSVHNPLIVMLLLGGLVVGGLHAFWSVNVEAYPDPAPPIVEVVAQYPGASAEEVERQVTIPLEVALAGMPGLTHVRTKSMFGLCHMRNQFDYGTDFKAARQEIINRLGSVNNLPQGVTPQISPFSPTGELMRYTIRTPRDQDANEIYPLQDVKAFQDWTLNRVFRRVQRIADVSSFGGKVKRYEVNPDPDKMRNLGLSLAQIQTAVTNGNGNVGGDYHTSGRTVQNVRVLGLIGGARIRSKACKCWTPSARSSSATLPKARGWRTSRASASKRYTTANGCGRDLPRRSVTWSPRRATKPDPRPAARRRLSRPSRCWPNTSGSGSSRPSHVCLSGRL